MGKMTQKKQPAMGVAGAASEGSSPQITDQIGRRRPGHGRYRQGHFCMLLCYHLFWYFCVNLITEDLENLQRVQNKPIKIVWDFLKNMRGEKNHEKDVTPSASMNKPWLDPNLKNPLTCILRTIRDIK